MAVFKLDNTDRALLRKALHVQGVKDRTIEETALLNLIERREITATPEQISVMTKGLVKFGHMARQFRNRNDARLAASLAERLELHRQEVKREAWQSGSGSD